MPKVGEAGVDRGSATMTSGSNTVERGSQLPTVDHPASFSGPPKLLDQMREVLSCRHYSRGKKQTYCQWVERCVFFHKVRHPAEMAQAGINADESLVQKAVCMAVTRAGLIKRATCHTSRHSLLPICLKVDTRSEQSRNSWATEMSRAR